MSAQDRGDHETDELMASEPGLERVVTALTADGDATELVGRQAALTMFRSVRGAQGAPVPGIARPGPALPGTADAATARVPRRARRARSRRSPQGLRSSLPARFPALVAAAAVLVSVGAAATAAAYAAALPAPVQQIAHRVFAPLGIPTAPAAAPASPGPGGPTAGGPGGSSGGPGPTGTGGSASAGPSGSGHPGASTPPATGATSSPGASPTTSASGSPAARPTAGGSSPGPATLMLTAATAQVTPGGQDTFTARLTQAGQPLALISVQLLEHDAGTATARVAASGVTDATGTVTLTATGLSVNAIFHAAGTGQFGAATSAKVTVAVIPSLAVRLSTATTLTVHALAPAAPGDVAVLQELANGAWIDVTTRKLGPQGRAGFPVVSGQTYRVALRATMAHGRAASAAITA